MFDEILEMLGRKKTTAGAKSGGLGGMLSRVQGALDGDDHGRHRAGPGRSHRDDGHDLDDAYDRDDERLDRRGRRRERDGFDLGDD